MGGVAGRGADEGAAKFAAGIPEELDWQTLITQVFQPAHQAVLLLTSDTQVEVPGGQPLKFIQCFRSSEEKPPPDIFNLEALQGRVGLMSQKGKKAAPNQDSAFYLQYLDGDGAQVWLACVMDGHGPLGHLMSRLTMQWLPLLVLREPILVADAGRLMPSDPQTVFDGISAAFVKMGAVMRRASAGSMDRELSGTTCVFALGARGLLHSANVGDSRAVLGTIKSEPGDSAFALRLEGRNITRDHKPEDVEERARIEAHGGVVERQRVYTTEWPYVGLNLSRSFGDSMVHAVGVSDQADVAATFLDSEASQFLLLASDGVWEFMSNQDAAETVAVELQDKDRPRRADVPPAPQGAAARLLRRAADCWRRECDELDDITAVIIKL